MATTERLHVFRRPDGSTYAKQLTPAELTAWLAAHPNDVKVR